MNTNETPRNPNTASVENGHAPGILWLNIASDHGPTSVCLLIREAVALRDALTAAIEKARA